MSTVTLADVKTALNETVNVDDAEIQRMINAAEAEYAMYVGPLPGTITETFDGGQSASRVLRSPYVTAITAASYADGSTLNLSDLTLDTDTGIVYWNSGSVGYFKAGTRNVSITYTTDELPLNHQEAIIADVTGYFESSQRGDSGAAFPGEGFDGAPYRSMPLMLFPRIRALAPPRVA